MLEIVSKAVKHLGLVNRHRWMVFKLCAKAGIPYRGLVHDLSKYSITEFWESVKYYNGSRSPIEFEKFTFAPLNIFCISIITIGSIDIKITISH